MESRRKRQVEKFVPEWKPLIQWYVLKILCEVDCLTEFVRAQGFASNALAAALGMQRFVDHFDYDGARVALRRRYRAIIQNQSVPMMPEPLASNLARLSDLVGLSETDRRILALAVLMATEPFLKGPCDWIGPVDTTATATVLSVMLDLPQADVRSALSSKGQLARSGLLTLDTNPTRQLSNKFDLVSQSFAHQICTSDVPPFELLCDSVKPAGPASLSLSDYGHISSWLDILLPHLRHALASGRNGVNVFIHGSPGTGKSQLARVLAKELGCELFEISFQDSDGDPIDAGGRLMSFRAAQCFFGKRHAMLVFDEVEDVFNDGGAYFGRPSTAQKHKAWINSALEDAAVPTLWLANSIRGVDPAFIRRFDMVIELPVPPLRQREQMIWAACQDLLSDPEVARLAQVSELAPAVIHRAASVARSIRDEIGVAGAAKAVQLLVGGTLKAQGHRLPNTGFENVSELYDPSFLQTDAELSPVVEGLIRSRSGRICLYGPPGTGKTAFGHWLAKRMDLPLMVRRASDLLSKWVGGNEKNIAAAFELASEQGAVLMIDEVDTFLRDRRGAQHSWEASLVNEMLTGMESFPGVFVASTNLMDGLDQASLRRFDLKVRFDYLNQSQAASLLSRHCVALDLGAPSDSDLNLLSRLSNLTPGDFAAVARQGRFRTVESATAFVAALACECSLKEGTKTAIGFLA